MKIPSLFWWSIIRRRTRQQQTTVCYIAYTAYTIHAFALNLAAVLNAPDHNIFHPPLFARMHEIILIYHCRKSRAHKRKITHAYLSHYSRNICIYLSIIAFVYMTVRLTVEKSSLFINSKTYLIDCTFYILYVKSMYFLKVEMNILPQIFFFFLITVHDTLLIL